MTISGRYIQVELYFFSFVTTGMDDILVFCRRIITPHSLQFFCYLSFDILTTDENMALWSKDPDALIDLWHLTPLKDGQIMQAHQNNKYAMYYCAHNYNSLAFESGIIWGSKFIVA